MRVVNQHLLSCWRELEPKDSTHRGLRKLMRYHQRNLKPEQWSRLENDLAQHPMMEPIYDFKQRRCQMLSIKHRTKKQCRKLIQQAVPEADPAISDCDSPAQAVGAGGAGEAGGRHWIGSGRRSR